MNEHLDTMDKEQRDKARALIERLCVTATQHLGPATKLQMARIRLELSELLRGSDYPRFLFWLTGYEEFNMPKPWANTLLRLLHDSKTPHDDMALLVDFFHYQQSDR